MRSTKAFLIGAGAAYFLSRMARGGARRAAALSYRLASQADDATIAERIRSDAFRDAGVSPGNVDLSVEEGVATLHGSVEDSKQADVLVERVASVPGVRDVAAMLRVSGTAKAA